MSGTERILRVCSRRSYFLIVRLGLIGLPHRFRDLTAKYFRDVDGVNCARHSTRCVMPSPGTDHGRLRAAFASRVVASTPIVLPLPSRRYSATPTPS